MDAIDNQNLYLLGHPVGHSKSAVMYNAAYKALGLNWHYQSCDLSTEGEARRFLEERAFLAVNITTPYKPLAFEMADHKAATAQLAQGVNVLVNYKDHLLGYNTDGIGCVSYLERVGVDFSGARIVVCGTGPTALSIVHACAQAGADLVMLLGREKKRAEGVLATYRNRYKELAYATIDLPAVVSSHRSFRSAYEQTTFKASGYSMAKKAISSADIVINATPLGMGKDDPSPFDTQLLSPHQLVFDVVYGRGITQLLHGAQEKGCQAFNGEGMLVAQALECLHIALDLFHVECSLSDDKLFGLMADAAGFMLLKGEKL